ncbi:hypothetical protein SERLADRAFT_458043, partial [Serpula lacrymans var. lacrymans S7.9]
MLTTTRVETVTKTVGAISSSVKPASAIPFSPSMDDLAVSFITETIQTIKAPAPRIPPSDAKSQLALRQQRLTEYISESKALMAQFERAQNKQEKDRIGSAIRDLNRCVLRIYFLGM